MTRSAEAHLAKILIASKTLNFREDVVAQLAHLGEWLRWSYLQKRQMLTALGASIKDSRRPERGAPSYEM